MMFSKKIKGIREVKRNDNTHVLFVRVFDLNNDSFFFNCLDGEFVKIDEKIKADKVADVVVNIYDKKYNGTWQRNFWVNFDG